MPAYLRGPHSSCLAYHGVQHHSHGHGSGAGGDLPATDEKRESGFFLDIKGSKFQKFEKHSPVVSFQVQAGGQSCFHALLKHLEEWQYFVKQALSTDFTFSDASNCVYLNTMK